MPLTKANSIVINIDDVSQSLKNALVDNGVRDYVDEQITSEHNSMIAADTLHRNDQAVINADIYDELEDIRNNQTSASGDVNTALNIIRFEMIMARQEAVPIGSIIMRSSDTGLNDTVTHQSVVYQRTGWWLSMDGQGYVIPTNSSNPLWTAYNQFGKAFNRSGDPTNIFRLPDFRGRVPAGVGVGYDINNVAKTIALAERLGEYMHTLTGAEMPIHSHTTNFGGSGNSDSGGGSPTAMHNKASNTNNAGGGLPHTIVQPYIGIRFYMKVSNNQVTETPTL